MNNKHLNSLSKCYKYSTIESRAKTAARFTIFCFRTSSNHVPAFQLVHKQDKKHNVKETKGVKFQNFLSDQQVNQFLMP